jgi:hypothetical protein
LPVRRVWRSSGRPIWRGCSATPWDFRLQKSSAAFSGLAHNADFELIEDPKQRADLRGAEPAARACHDGGNVVIPNHRRRHQGGAGDRDWQPDFG